MNQTIPKAKATIKDVATLSGVSISTVSRALSKQPKNHRHSESTILRIREIAKKVNYQPDKNAAMLARNSRPNPTIAILMPTPRGAENLDNQGSLDSQSGIAGGMHNQEIMNGIVDLASQKSINVNIRQWPYDPLGPVTGVTLSPDWSLIDGLILHNWGGIVPGLIGQLEKLAIPFVVANHYIDEPGIPCVGGDFHEAGLRVMRYLTGLGHRRIVYLIANPLIKRIQEYLAGLKKGCEDAGIVFSEDNIIVGDYRTINEFAIRKLMMQDQVPTAFVTVADILAIKLIGLLTDMGVEVPKAASVIGFGDVFFSTLMRPKLTTVNEHGRQIGIEAMEMLSGLIAGNAVVTKRKLTFELVERNTCGLVHGI